MGPLTGEPAYGPTVDEATRAFGKKAESDLPEELRPALAPLLRQIAEVTKSIALYDEKVKQLAEEDYPEAARLRQVAGVGALTAVAFVLTIEDPRRFKSSRAVGSFLGLRPRQSDSGESAPQLRITKAGDGYLRRLLVGSAQYALGPFGPDSDLRRFGLKLAERGGKNAKKRAVVAVARKLSVLLHRLWVTGEPYEPLRNAAKEALREGTEAALDARANRPCGVEPSSGGGRTRKATRGDGTAA